MAAVGGVTGHRHAGPQSLALAIRRVDGVVLADLARFAVPVAGTCWPRSESQFTVVGEVEGSRSQQHPGSPAATAVLAVSRAGAGTAWGSGLVVGVGREGR